MRKLISLYTGAGGLDLGFEAAGFETAVAVEVAERAVETLLFNRSWPVLARDIHKIPSSVLLDTAGFKEGEADVLIGGPPCQPFSKSAYWATGDSLRLEDPRAGTIGAYFRVLRDALPRAFLLENVPGLIYRSKSEGLELIHRTLARINIEKGTSYWPLVCKLNAADFGVPQMRERVFIVGSRDGIPFEFPSPTHGGSGSLLFEPDDLEPRNNAWDAIGDLEENDDPELTLRGKWAELLPSVPEGENYLWHTNRGGGLELFGWRRRYWSFLLKLAKDRPSWTLQAQPGPSVGPFHWKNRRLSARELCRLQTIPNDYVITGSLLEVQKQVGNAVPSALAEVLARAIRRQLLGDKKLARRATLIPLKRLPVPKPEAVMPVPAKYLHLVGDHEAHPGTGKGYAAIQRNEVVV